MSFSGTLAVTQTVLEVGDGHHRGGRIVRKSPGATCEIDHAAGHRRSNRHHARFVWRVGIRRRRSDADARLARSILHLGRDIVRFGLLQVLVGRAADFLQAELAIAALEREREQGLGALVVGISAAEIAGIDARQAAARLHPLAELDLELRHADRDSGGDTLMRWAGSASTTAGSTRSRLISFAAMGSIASAAYRRALGHRHAVARAQTVAAFSTTSPAR